MSLAVVQPVYIQRACLDRVSGILTVYFNPPSSDLCGSFDSYNLYGRDNTANPFSLLATNKVLGSIQIQTPLPNKKQWELFITTKFACNGTDTFNSDTILIDDTPPAYLEPDSISVDLVTQKVVAGWPQSPEPDVMGYTLFKSDPSNGNNILIDKTSGLYYSFNTSTFNPLATGNRYRMAAYDSCDNGGPISSYHSPILLQPATDPSGKNYQCTKNLFIQWSAYIGWTVSAYDIFVKDNISNTWSLISTLPSNQLDYSYTFSTLGLTYSFFVRAHKTGSTISSSSNVIDIPTSDFTKPSFLSIGHVSVVSEGTLEITGLWDTSSGINEVFLEGRNYGSSTWGKLATYSNPKSTFIYKDNGKNTNTQKYTYRLVASNTCNQIFDSSSIHTSLLLRRTYNQFYWNSYWAWETLNHTINIENRDKQGFTWNSEGSNPDTSFILFDTAQALCYRVISLRYSFNNKSIDTAYSNEICLKSFDTTLIPTAFTPGGINPIFKITNKNIIPGQAKMTIYDRWGGKIYQGDALQGWDGTATNGEFVGPGIYPYTVQITRIEKRELYKGTVTILR